MIEIGIDVQMMIVDRTLRRKMKMMRDDEQRAEVGGLLHGGDRPLDVLRLIVEERQVDRRHLAVDPLDLRAARPSAIATVFLPDCFVTCRRTPGLPLMRVNERRSSVVSMTSAMSRR